MEDEFFDYIDRIRESRGIDAKDLARLIWPELSIGAAATKYSRYKGLDGAKKQSVKLADAEAMCSALGLNMASVIFELKEKKRLV